MKDRIGIVVWGCKRGCQLSLCDNGVMDINKIEIQNTLKDVRSFVRIHELGVDYYALEFTRDYKVYTQYRSSNDSGTGAFIAVTLFVPHKLRLEGTRKVLGEMMDAYFRDYMSYDGSPLASKLEDIDIFQDILNRHATDVKFDNRRQHHVTSRQDDCPQIITYTDLGKVDKYYDDPYHPEFYLCQEVMFMRRELFERPTEYHVSFGVGRPTEITHISPPSPQTVLGQYASSVYRLICLHINGEDCTDLIQSEDIPICDTDSFSLCVDREHYRSLEKFEFSLAQAESWGLIRKVAPYRYELSTEFDLQEKEYIIPVQSLFNIKSTDLIDYLTLDDGRNVYPLKDLQNGSQGFIIYGPRVEQIMRLRLSLVKNSRNPQSSFVLQEVVPQDILRQASPMLQVDVRRHTLSMTFPYKVPRGETQYATTIRLYDGRTITFSSPVSKVSDKFELLLPGRLEIADISVSLPGFRCQHDNGTYTFTPVEIEVELCMPKQLVSKLDQSRKEVTFEFNEQSYKAVKVIGGGMFSFSNQEHFCFQLPFEENLAAYTIGGRLHIGGTSFDVQMNSHDKMCFHAVLVENKCASEIQLTVTRIRDQRDDVTTFPIKSGDFLLLEEGCQPGLISAECRLQEGEEYRKANTSVKVYNIIPNNKSNQSSSNPPSDNTYKPGIVDRGNKPSEFRCKLINCDKFYAKFKCGGIYARVKIDDLNLHESFRLNETENIPYCLYDENNKKVVCKVFPSYDPHPEEDSKNKSNGFRVKYETYGNTETFVIEYTGPSVVIKRLIHNLLQKLRRGLRIIGLGVLIAVALLVLVYYTVPYLKNIIPHDEKMSFCFYTDDGISNIEKVVSNNKRFTSQGPDTLLFRGDRQKGGEWEDTEITIKFRNDKDTTILITSLEAIPQSLQDESLTSDVIRVLVKSPAQQVFEELQDQYQDLLNEPNDSACNHFMQQCEMAATSIESSSYKEKINSLKKDVEDRVENLRQQAEYKKLENEYKCLKDKLKGIFTTEDINNIRTFERKFKDDRHKISKRINDNNYNALKNIINESNYKIKQYENFIKAEKLDSMQFESFQKNLMTAVRNSLPKSQRQKPPRDFIKWCEIYNKLPSNKADKTWSTFKKLFDERTNNK